MMNLSRLRLITFDVTDTLLQFRLSPGKQYGEIGALYGVICNEKALARSFKIHWVKMNNDHPNYGLHSGLGWDKWWRVVVHETFRDCDSKCDNKKLDAIATHLIETYKTSACWQLCYGAKDLLDYLKSTDITVGVISNFDQRLTTILDNMKISDYFKFVVSSFDAACQKPDKMIFDKALEMSGLGLDSGQAMHVGNKPELDYLGATNAGWNGVLIYTKDSVDLEKKHPGVDLNHVFRNLYEFHLFLRNNLNK